MNLQSEILQRRTAIVAPQDRLDAVTAPAFQRALAELEAAGVHDFVIDLSVTPHLDVAGLAVLVQLLRRCRQQGGDVQLVRPSAGAVRRMLALTQFDAVFRMTAPQTAS